VEVNIKLRVASDLIPPKREWLFSLLPRSRQQGAFQDFRGGGIPEDASPAGSGVTSDCPSQGREVAMP
jgi:hypothetical protein